MSQAIMTGTDDLPDLPNTCRKGAQTPSKMDKYGQQTVASSAGGDNSKKCPRGAKKPDSRARKTERAGFEPAVPARGTPVFETGSISHSDTSPNY
jgi:hypothetical protein